jgi:hypothetical protein
MIRSPSHWLGPARSAASAASAGRGEILTMPAIFPRSNLARPRARLSANRRPAPCLAGLGPTRKWPGRWPQATPTSVARGAGRGVACRLPVRCLRRQNRWRPGSGEGHLLLGKLPTVSSTTLRFAPEIPFTARVPLLNAPALVTVSNPWWGIVVVQGREAQGLTGVGIEFRTGVRRLGYRQ